MSKRINIVLPDATIGVLDRVAPKGGRSQFIDKAVLHYVESERKKDLRERLAEGYRLSAELDRQMAAEWLPLEEEAWLLLEAEEKAYEEATKTQPK